MSVKQLIDGQVIKIDNHCRGCEFKWGEGVHLHKRMNKDKFSKAEVLIPIADNERESELEFRNLQGIKSSQIKNEIVKAFKNKAIRRDFILSFYKALDEILSNEGFDKEKKIEIAKKSAKHIAKLFGLNPKVKDYFCEEADKYYVQFSRRNNRDFHILVDIKNRDFIIGESISDINQYNLEE
ncbi:hypothetical protein F070042J6_09750 [Bacteroides sp. f07]|uniref:hypothetical protein n=1 Tax=Bacteroides sp. f07 TaxID=3132704 RepID=UPI0034B08F39